jgi:GH15 family glucan-1,4-alpha-glucosidase
MSQLPIGDYALLSDCHSAALVSRVGSVDWLCFPRFDSPSIFGRLLGDDAGHWAIHPARSFSSARRYRENTLLLETTFETEGGTALLVDAMPIGRNERGHELGALAPHALLRTVTCTRGEVVMQMDYAPRPEYGLVQPLLTGADGGIRGRGGADVLFLSSEVDVDISGSVGRATFSLRAGESARFAVQHRTSSEPMPTRWLPLEIEQRIEDTAEAWRTWSSLHQRYDGPWRDLVHLSGRVLYALTFFPTGAIVAAPTTSLPEAQGGPRNWDYRYCWVRDSCFTLEALWVAACPDEAHKYFGFLTDAALSQVRRGSDLQIMFGIGGEHDLSEREIPHLPGWRRSFPVRVGNGAWNQRQLDVYGELVGAAHRLREQVELSPIQREFISEVADAAASRWEMTDNGIWEVRGEPRPFVYSKLMCWTALDRAIELAPLLGAQDRLAHWSEVREAIRHRILDEGWSGRAGAFTQSFGSDDLDASNLVMPIVGFLPADDPKMLATIDAIAARLTDENGLVYRYRGQDGLEGQEGTFLLCTFWLAQAQAMAGQVDRARETFTAAAKFVNDVGLLSEEVDPSSGELLGNFPQAFSHIGLVNAAWAITQAEERRHEKERTAP